MGNGGISRSAHGWQAEGLALRQADPTDEVPGADFDTEQIRPPKPRETTGCPMDPAKMLEGTRFQGLDSVNYNDIVWQVRCQLLRPTCFWWDL